MPALFPLDPAYRLVSNQEITAILTEALSGAAGGSITRDASAWMACIGAQHLADRLALAGLVMVRHETGRDLANPA